MTRVRDAKSEFGQQKSKKEYIYFRQLSYLLPICNTRPHNDGESSDEKETEGENQLPDHPIYQQQKKKKTLVSEEQALLQTLSGNIEKKKKATLPDDPDKNFLQSLLPPFKPT